VNNNV